ncbi:hypothetical protein GDO81_018340 [Engystomops pustulosus]|uniref:Uncharacterized protein n=1 Tax=Engystomops pustulosus TaxID=76066 RepID=A0AAV7AB75_ENGPU|nr:hypothetical protein GDO81_018340 [Engystomops pustulosus]
MGQRQIDENSPVDNEWIGDNSSIWISPRLGIGSATNTYFVATLYYEMNMMPYRNGYNSPQNVPLYNKQDGANIELEAVPGLHTR